MEQGVYDYISTLPGVRQSSIKITSVLSRSGRQASVPNAAIITLSEVDLNNKTIIDSSAREVEPPTAEELAQGTAALDEEILRDATADAGDSETGLSTQRARRFRRVRLGAALVRVWALYINEHSMR